MFKSVHQHTVTTELRGDDSIINLASKTYTTIDTGILNRLRHLYNMDNSKMTQEEFDEYFELLHVILHQHDEE